MHSLHVIWLAYSNSTQLKVYGGRRCEHLYVRSKISADYN